MTCLGYSIVFVIGELKQFCHQEWSKIIPGCCAGLIHSYRKHLLEVIAAKGGSLNFVYLMGVFNKDMTVCVLSA